MVPRATKGVPVYVMPAGTVRSTRPLYQALKYNPNTNRFVGWIGRLLGLSQYYCLLYGTCFKDENIKTKGLGLAMY